jgi:hypothetical protein
MLPCVNSAWLRPYTPGRGRWLIVGWELGGLAFVDWTTIRLFDLGATEAGVITGLLAVAWLVGSWRILRMGVYVSEYGVRIRSLFGSRTLRWTDIDQFAIDQPVYRFGTLEVPAGMTVLIRHRNGQLVNTSLWAQGIDFHSRPRQFREVYGLLCERHSAAVDLA